MTHEADRWWRGWARAATLTLALLAGCGERDRLAQDQEVDLEAQRQWYAGCVAAWIAPRGVPAEAFAAPTARLVTFDLQGEHAERHHGPPGVLASEASVHLVHLGEHADGQAAWWLVDPRSLRLEPMTGTHVVVVRSVPLGGWAGLTRAHLQLVRVDIDLARERVQAVRRLSPSATDQLFPVVLPGPARVVYQEQGPHGERLCWVPLDGGPGSALPIRDQDVAMGAGDTPPPARAPMLDGEGQLLIQVRHGQAWRTRRYDPATGHTAAIPLAEPVSDRSVTLSRDPSGIIIRCLPAVCSVAELDAWAEAHAPAIARRRALVAAAMAEEQQSRLASWPTLSAGILYNPISGVLVSPSGFSGDYLAQGVVRGLLGLSQPLLDLPRNQALSAAAVVRIQLARDALDEERNEVISQLEQAAVAWTALAERIALDQQAVAEAEHWRETVRRRVRSGVDGTGESQEADAGVLGATSQRDADVREREVQAWTLRQLCGLDRRAPLEVRLDLAAAAGRIDLDPEEEGLVAAVSSHPRLLAARATLQEAFALGQAGAAIRPEAGLGAGYGLDLHQGRHPVDDFTTLSLTGSLPVAWLQDRRLQAQRTAAVAAALRAHRADLAGTVEIAYRHAWKDWLDASETLEVRTAEAQAARTVLREAQARVARGEAARRGGDPLDAHAVPRLVVAAEQADRALAQAQADRLIAAIRVRENQGLLPERPVVPWALVAGHPTAAGAAADGSSAAPAATPALLGTDDVLVFAWTTPTLAATPALPAALARLHRQGVDGLAVYVGARGELLGSEDHPGPARLLLRDAHAAGLRGSALIGEPEWLQPDGPTPAQALAQIQQLPAGVVDLVECDCEPTALPAWQHPKERQALVGRWLHLLGQLRDRLGPSLPVEATMPAWMLTEAGADDPDPGALATCVRRVSVMCYAPEASRVRALAAQAATRWSGPLRIVLELNPRAPADVRLDAAAAADWEGLSRSLAHIPHQPPLTIGLHDLHSLLALTAPGSSP